MMSGFDILSGVVGCTLSGFGLLASILTSAEWVLIVTVVGVLMVGGAILHNNYAERKHYEEYQPPRYSYNR